MPCGSKSNPGYANERQLAFGLCQYQRVWEGGGRGGRGWGGWSRKHALLLPTLNPKPKQGCHDCRLQIAYIQPVTESMSNSLAVLSKCSTSCCTAQQHLDSSVAYMQRNSKHGNVVAHLCPGTYGASQHVGPPVGKSPPVSCTLEPGPGQEALPPDRPRLLAHPVCMHTLQLPLLLPLVVLTCLEASPCREAKSESGKVPARRAT